MLPRRRGTTQVRTPRLIRIQGEYAVAPGRVGPMEVGQRYRSPWADPHFGNYDGMATTFSNPNDFMPGAHIQLHPGQPN